MISEGESYPSLDKAHAVTSSLMLGMVFIHVIGVLLGSLLHKENLIGAMITGYKPNCEREGISQSYRWLGIALACFVTMFWIFSL